MILSNRTQTNNSVTSQVASDTMNRDAIDISASRNFICSTLLGKKLPDGPKGIPMFTRLNRVSGLDKEIRLRVAQPTPSAVGKGKAAALAFIEPSFDENKYGLAPFDLTLFSDTVFVPYWDTKRVEDDLEKGQGALVEEMGTWIDGIQTHIETSVCGTANQTDTTIGGIQYALADGTVIAHNTYLGIDRSLSENSTFRSQAAAVSASLDLGEVQNMQNRVLQGQGGSCALGLSGINNYQFIQGLMSSVYTVNAETNPDYMRWVGHYTQIGPTRFTSSIRFSDSKIAFISPETWMFHMNEDGFQVGEFKESQLVQAAYQTTLHWSFAFVCSNPKRNGILTGASS